MTCRKYRRQLIPWLDGELKPDRAAILKAWFDSCEEVRHCNDCRKLANEYRSFHDAFNHTSQAEFPAFLHNRIIAEIQSRESLYHKRAVRSRWQTIPAAAAILLSLYFGTLIGVQTFSTQTTTENEAAELYTFGEYGTASTIYANGGWE